MLPTALKCFEVGVEPAVAFAFVQGTPMAGDVEPHVRGRAIIDRHTPVRGLAKSFLWHGSG